MSGQAEILAYWERALLHLQGRLRPGAYAAIKEMVVATWDALEANGHDVAKLRSQVQRLLAEGDHGRGTQAGAG